jgi:hypothetical protein
MLAVTFSISYHTPGKSTPLYNNPQIEQIALAPHPPDAIN